MGGHGTMNYVELPVTDLARAADFAEAVFGWKVHRDDGPYWGFQTADDAHAGAFEQVGSPTPHAGGPTVYVMVDDLDAALERVPAHGGTVLLGRTEIPGGDGFYAHVTDPDGNRLGLWAKD